ncbi:ornithine cyclodeaminase family protein [Antrihabitans spumae]|uniref:Ornithine cyclodeaminase family protein n=1 Tax=Antrihabitans spumae TaxID=3373370 RepID=A0ABW7K331_9NOCA
MTLILRHSDITPLLDRNEVRHAVEAAFAGLAGGEFSNPAPGRLTLPTNGSALPMAACTNDRVAVKLLCDIPSNRDRALPTQRSTILVTSATTGACVAILDGRAVTAIRTAAASAVATAHLARPTASTLGLIGAGNLAIEHAHAVAAVRDIQRIIIWSRTTATIDAFRSATECLGIPVHSAPSVEAVMDAADIVCTVTPSEEPIVCGKCLRQGQHINAVGAPPRPDHREIDSVGMARARIIVDSHTTTMSKSGAVLIAIADGFITEEDARTELGHVINGTAPGRTTDDDITIFESVGIGLQDLVTAKLVIDHATRLGAGTTVDLTA